MSPKKKPSILGKRPKREGTAIESTVTNIETTTTETSNKDMSSVRTYKSLQINSNNQLSTTTDTASTAPTLSNTIEPTTSEESG